MLDAYRSERIVLSAAGASAAGDVAPPPLRVAAMGAASPSTAPGVMTISSHASATITPPDSAR